MKNVLVLNQFALPRTEGGGTRHIDLFGRLAGCKILIVAGGRNHYTQQPFSTDDPRFWLIWVPPNNGGSVARLLGWLIYASQAVLLGLARRNVDLVVGSSPQPLAALAGLVIARLRRAPFVLEVRDLWPESAVSAGRLRSDSAVYALFRKLEKFLANNADRIICVTVGWEDHFSDLGISSDHLVVIPNGSEPADFVVHAPRSELRERYGVHGFTAIFAGAHGPKDGIDLILDAAKHLPEIQFLLVGSGTVKANSLERARYEQIDNVEFREPVSKVELPGLLRACDVGIHAVSPLPVFSHGMSPNKLFDYMAAGLPVVSNAEEGLTHIMTDGECGRLGSANDLALCLRAVVAATNEQRDEWSRRASEILGQRFSRRRAAETLSRTVNEMLADPLMGST